MKNKIGRSSKYLDRNGTNGNKVVKLEDFEGFKKEVKEELTKLSIKVDRLNNTDSIETAINEINLKIDGIGNKILDQSECREILRDDEIDVSNNLLTDRASLGILLLIVGFVTVVVLLVCLFLSRYITFDFPNVVIEELKMHITTL